jgi:predicted Zn-dependent protease
MWPYSPCVLDLQGLKWEFAVIDSDQVNAFVVPGGKVVVYTGLLKLLQGPAMETQLAAVLGHEIAHVVARHAVSYSRHREKQVFEFMPLHKSLLVPRAHLAVAPCFT